MRVVAAARAVIDAIAVATDNGEVEAAAAAFEHLAATTMAGGDSVLDLLAFEDMQAELTAEAEAAAPTP